MAAPTPVHRPARDPAMPARFVPVQALGQIGGLAATLVEDTVRRGPVVWLVADDAQGAVRLAREFQLTACLRHPQVASALDFGRLPDGRAWLTRAWDEARPLRRANGMAEVERLAFQGLAALADLHRLGLTHGHLDGEALRVTPDGRLKLVGLHGKGTPASARKDLVAFGHWLADLLMPPVPAPLAMLANGLTTGRCADAEAALAMLGDLPPPGLGDVLIAPPLIGRDAERGLLRTLVADVAAGRPGGLHWLMGPAGSGKSRLLDEVRVEAQLAGVAFAAGHQPAYGGVPYQPFVTALKQLLPTLRAQVPEALARAAVPLSSLLPELGEPDPEPLDPAKQQLRLFAAVGELLFALGARQGLVLAFEGWSAEDAQSDALLAFLRRNAGPQPLAIVVASRPMAAGPPWTADAQLHALAPLDDGAIGRLAVAMVGAGACDAHLDRQVVDFSAGLPLLAEQVLQHLVASGALVRRRGRWQPADAPGQPPPTLAALVDATLTGLPPGLARIAQVAAVLGAWIDPALLAATAGVDEAEASDTIARLMEARILVPAADGRMRFAQADVQAALAAGLAPDARRVVHAAAAEALVARHAGEPPDQTPLEAATAIAAHAREAGLGALSVPWSLTVGRRQAALYANDAAEATLEAGLAECVASGRAAWRHLRLDFLAAHADVRRLSGKLGAAESSGREAIALAEALDDPRRGRLLTSLAQVRQGLDDLPEALALAEAGVAACLAVSDAAGAARGLLTLARVRLFLADAAGARVAAERALALATGDRVRTAEALGLLGYLEVGTPGGRPAAGVERLHEAIALALELGDKVGLNLSHLLLGNAQLALGELLAARKSFTLARWICQEVGNRVEEGIALINLAVVALELGEPGDALAWAEAAERHAGPLEHQFQHGLARVLAASARLLLGRPDGAPLAPFDDALALAGRLENAYLDALIRPYAAEAALWLGQPDLALAHARVLAERIDASAHREAESRLAVLVAEAEARRGERTPAGLRALADTALDATLTAGARVYEVRARKLLASLALAAGDLEGARAQALAGQALSATLRTRLQTVELEGLLGAIAAATGTAEALDHYQAMQARAEEVGAPLLIALSLAGQAAHGLDDAQRQADGTEARRIMASLLEALPPTDRAAFQAYPERSRLAPRLPSSSG